MTRQLYGIIAIVILALIILTFGPAACQKMRSQAAQSRVDSAQSGAAHESAAEAINTVAASGARESASEDLTRTNEQEIRHADGANERVKAGVDVAGRRALCRRDAYKNDPRCSVLR